MHTEQSQTEMRFLGGESWSGIHRAMQAAFADYALDMSYMTEDYLRCRSRKNGVDLALSPGLFADGELVGFTLVGVGPWKGGRLAAFDAGTGLVSAWRGKGYASALFDHTLPLLRGRGVETFVLDVLQENAPAIRAYEKSGFSIVRELDCYDLRPQAAITPLPLPGGVRLEDGTVADTDAFEAGAEWPLSWECSWAAQRRSGPDMVFRLARVAGEVVGLASFHTRLGWLMSLQVREDHRGRGIGTALVNSLLVDFGRVGGRIRADNIVREDQGTQRLLKRMGFSLLVSQYEMEYPL